MSIACVYLSRAAEGIAPLEDFLASYQKFNSGLDHSFIVIFKGYTEAERLIANERLAEFSFQSFDISDAGFDITAYIGVIERFEYDYFCFLNTFSVIKTDGWLKKLTENLKKPGVGMVSGSGSYESLIDTYYYVDSVAHHYLRRFMTTRNRWKPYIHFLMRGHYARELAIPQKDHIKSALKHPLNSYLLMSRRTYLNKMFGSGGEREWTKIWPRFPNPHLRSNAFMISRSLFREFNFVPPMTKIESYEFESGIGSISARIMQKGLQLLVVGASGIGYSIEDWSKAATFRSSSQENLLISDNQTRQFDAMSPQEKITCQFFTWGTKSLQPLPSDFPSFGRLFDAKFPKE